MSVRPCALSWRLLRLMLAAAIFWSVTPLFAHDPGLSTAEAIWDGRVLKLTTSFSPGDAKQLLPATQRSDMASAFEAIAPALWESKRGDSPLRSSSIRVTATHDNVSIEQLFAPESRIGAIDLRAVQLSRLPPGHRQFFIVTDPQGRALVKKMLSAKDDRIVFVPPSLEPNASDVTRRSVPAFLGFVRLGIEHIWTGYDHLLFLFALLIVCRSFRSIVAIISCFTLAHSLTLALATIGVVNVSARITEPAIAASIVFVGVENIIRGGDEPRGRWLLTFAFGLIHGFGFASVLRDLGVGQHGDGVAVPLFSFNLGVEMGQVAVAAIVLPIVWWVRRDDRFVRAGVPALSVIVAGAGAYWVLQRTIFA